MSQKRRFELSTVQYSILITTWDAVCITLTLLIERKTKHVVKRGKLFFASSFIMSLAILLFSLPHFFLNEYLPLDNNDSNSTVVTESTRSHSFSWFMFLIAMSLVASVAYLPLYTTGKMWNHLDQTCINFRLYNMREGDWWAERCSKHWTHQCSWQYVWFNLRPRTRHSSQFALGGSFQGKLACSFLGFVRQKHHWNYCNQKLTLQDSADW